MPFFKAVLFDWVGTLIVPKWGPTRGQPRGASWIGSSLRQVGREVSTAEVERVSAALNAAGRRPDVAEGWAGADLSAAAHRENYDRWVNAAGVDRRLAGVMYESLCDATDNQFAVDVEPTLGALKAAGVKVAIVSDIHVDIRPSFAKAGLDTYVDDFVLSFECGACKPDPAVFRTALERLGVQPDEALMVGDRSGHDGAAVEAGLTTLLVPPLTHVTEKRLHLVLATCSVPGL
ncbi:HAD family hydrolase [Streptacidiphilus fuscans]|uniref:HAD family hydrolase n=1 Tax=Streptacidiphilus fuscans TaxID=2789292 RepID=A0A931B2R5_9ACTN|nr:HAD family hydrolase [Streptacidiphilus fuscans]MBF9069208.1 HAD family hydrolase [Streptacidiphilus fuscans]